MCLCARAHARPACVQRSEDNLCKLVLCLHHMNSVDQTRILRLGIKCLYLLSHPPCTWLSFSRDYSREVSSLKKQVRRDIAASQATLPSALPSIPPVTKGKVFS